LTKINLHKTDGRRTNEDTLAKSGCGFANCRAAFDANGFHARCPQFTAWVGNDTYVVVNQDDTKFSVLTKADYNAVENNVAELIRQTDRVVLKELAMMDPRPNLDLDRVRVSSMTTTEIRDLEVAYEREKYALAEFLRLRNLPRLLEKVKEMFPSVASVKTVVDWIGKRDELRELGLVFSKFLSLDAFKKAMLDLRLRTQPSGTEKALHVQMAILVVPVLMKPFGFRQDTEYDAPTDEEFADGKL
jgi:hypothetical protein